MKGLLAILLIPACAAPLAAQTPTPPPTPPPAVQISGSITTGIQQFDNSTGSSKLTEYRDFKDDLYLPSVTFSARDTRTGWFFDVRAVNVSRNDQTLRASGGRPGAWALEAAWTEIPHTLSNKAVTPYIARAPGRLEVPATAPITFKKLAT